MALFLRPRLSVSPPVILLFLVLLVSPGWGLETSFHWLCTGDWRGQVATWTNPEQLLAEPICRLPEWFPQAQRRSRFPLRLFAGNAFSRFSPVSVLANGEVEESLMKACHFDIVALGPTDLERFREKRVFSSDLFSRIWTNVEYAPGINPFVEARVLENTTEKVGVGSLIDPVLLKCHPIVAWNGYSVENPARAIRRMRLRHPLVRAWVWVGHLTTTQVFVLLPLLPDRDRLLWVPPGEDPDAEEKLGDEIHRGMHPRIWCLDQGSRQVLSIRTEVREGGRQVDSIRRLDPVPEQSTGFAPPPFMTPSLRKLRAELVKPLRIIPFSEHPLNVPFQISPALHARLAREMLRSDFALLGFPEVPYQTVRIWNMGAIVALIPPSGLREYEVSGKELSNLLEMLFQRQSPLFLGLDGAQGGFLNHQITRFRLSSGMIQSDRRYRVTLNAELYDDPVIRNGLPDRAEPGKHGWTLWDCWQKELPNLPRHVKMGGEG
jgi:hypothetical protein